MDWVNVIDGVLRPTWLECHTWLCPCIPKVGSNVCVKGHWRALYQLKKPFKQSKQGSCWKEWKKKVFTQWGGIDLPCNDFWINDLQPLLLPQIFNCLHPHTWKKISFDSQNILALVSTWTPRIALMCSLDSAFAKILWTEPIPILLQSVWLEESSHQSGIQYGKRGLTLDEVPLSRQVLRLPGSLSRILSSVFHWEFCTQQRSRASPKKRSSSLPYCNPDP